MVGVVDNGRLIFSHQYTVNIFLPNNRCRHHAFDLSEEANQ